MDEQELGLITSYAGLLTLATTSIYAGAFGSLSKPRRKKALDAEDIDDDDDDEDESVSERLSSSDAYLFPIFGSFFLAGIYLIFKYLDKVWINWLLGWYFAFTGVASVWRTSTAAVRTALGPKAWKSFTRYKLLLLKGPREELFSLSMRTPTVLLLIPAFVPSALYTLTASTAKKPALLTNILALSFSHNALTLLKLDGFKTGCILLAGLFFYDIWWVFGTEVMVKVATTLDGPIKILWAKNFDFTGASGFTMLGLGDIVIPGTFISLALRYDLYRSPSRDPSQPFAKPYFVAALTAYVLGLVTTMTVMHVFHAAQPALLYLSPACILSFFLTALVRGELKEAWAWTDEEENKEEEAKKEEAKEDKVTEEKVETNGVAAVQKPVEKAPETGTEGEGEPEKKRKTKKRK